MHAVVPKNGGSSICMNMKCLSRFKKKGKSETVCVKAQVNAYTIKKKKSLKGYISSAYIKYYFQARVQRKTCFISFEFGTYKYIN